MKRNLLLRWLPVFVTAGLLTLTLRAQTTNVNVSPGILASYVGQYELAPGFVLTIRKDGDHLNAQATGQGQVGLSAQSETEFKVLGVEASITFQKDKDGKIKSLILHQNGDHDAARISSEVPNEHVAIKVDPKIYDAYVGQYELAPGATFTIRRDGDKLRAQLTGQGSFQVFPESETNFFYKVVDAQLTFVKNPDGKVSKLILHQGGDKEAAKTSSEVPPLPGPDLKKIEARDPKAGARLVNLNGKYNSLLTEQWHPDANGLPSGANHLAALSRGVQKLGGVDFDVRGLIQLTGTQAEALGPAFPESVTGIKVGQKAKRLHFLHGAGWSAVSVKSTTEGAACGEGLGLAAGLLREVGWEGRM